MAATNESNRTKTLVINPASHLDCGAGIAIIDEGGNNLETCGFLSASDNAELANSSCHFWQRHMGSQAKPQTLCIAYYQVLTKKCDDNMHYRAIALNGMLSELFNPKALLTSTPYQWKENRPKEIYPDNTIPAFDQRSKHILMEMLNTIPRSKWQIVIDAVSLGLYFNARYSEDKIVKITSAA